MSGTGWMWLARLEHLDDRVARFVHRDPSFVTNDPSAATFTLPVGVWESMGRPGQIHVEVTP